MSWWWFTQWLEGEAGSVAGRSSISLVCVHRRNHLNHQIINQFVRWAWFRWATLDSFVDIVEFKFENFMYVCSCGIMIKFGDQLPLITSIRMTIQSKMNPLASLSTNQQRRTLSPSSESTLWTSVTLKISEDGLFNYCVLMIKWKQHNGLINSLITVSTKSHYNQIHHLSIKLKQSPLSTFQTGQTSRLVQTSASSQDGVYQETATQGDWKTRNVLKLSNVKNNNPARLLWPAITWTLPITKKGNWTVGTIMWNTA